MQKQMVNIFKKQRPEYIRAIIGHRGSAFDTRFMYFEAHNFWAVFDEDINRYWNAFGVGKPIAGKNNSITCEINFPYEGIDRRIAGVLGKEGDQIILLHRGKIGGGRTGIGKNLFLKNYRGSLIGIQDGNVENYLALIGPLDSKYFLQQVATFVHEVQRIKDSVDSSTLETEEEPDEEETFEFGFDFKEEGYGRRSYSRKAEIEAFSNHGIIINALARQLAGKGLIVRNDGKRDLFTLNGNKVDRVFEAKTDLSNNSIYSAIGQVLIYSAEIGLDGNQKILVLPERLKPPIENSIAKLGLDILYYTFEDETVQFVDLDRILAKK